MRHNIKKCAFTLVELLVAGSIAIIVVGGAVALWLMTQEIWIKERAKSASLQDVQITIERIKREMQMSDSNKIFFYTASDGTYDAISFPLAIDDDKDGFLETDATTKIYWDQTVIYHVWHDDTLDLDELKRTVFLQRNNALSAANRQLQIDKVVLLGTGDDASIPEYTAGKQSTRSIFKAKSISLEATPQYREFDGYNADTQRTENLITFGSAVLTGGYHTIKFKVTGKNPSPSCTGYALGIDLLKFTPPGTVQEGEGFVGLTYPDSSSGVAGSSSGDTISVVNTRSLSGGIWSNNYYLDYAANSIDDYLTLRFYYNRWNETTFLDGIAKNVVVEFSDTNGQGGTETSEEYIARLEGNEITWEANTQVQSPQIGSEALAAGTNNITYRNVISSNYMDASGRLISVKFRAGDNLEDHHLTIQEAYIVQKDDSETGSGLPYDGLPSMPSIPITFNHCDLDPRNDPAHHVEQSGLPTSDTGNDVTIEPGGYAWSNWIELEGPTSNAFNLDKTKDYLITFYVKTAGFAESQEVLYWNDTTLSASDPIDKKHAFKIASSTDTNYAATQQWSTIPGVTIDAQTAIYGVEDVAVTYVDSSVLEAPASFTSQVCDTGVETPSYGTMDWTAVTNNPDASLTMKVRTAATKTALEADGDWTAISGITLSSNPASLASLTKQRYVQFKAEFYANPSDGISSHITDDADDPADHQYPRDEDYDITSVLKDVSIYWPGNTTMVDIGGYFTKKSNYGKFTIEIDGKKLIKGVEVKLAATERCSAGRDITRSTLVEVEPRNTNK